MRLLLILFIASTIAFTLVYLLLLGQSPDSYLDCGCGCCPGTAPIQKCVNESDFINIATSQLDADCTVAGCSRGINYTECKNASY